MLIARFAMAATLAASLTFVGASAAGADPVGEVYCDQNPAPGCIVRARSPGQTGTVTADPDGDVGPCHNASGGEVPCYIAGRGSLGSDGCYFERVDIGPPPAGAQGPGAWHRRSCGQDSMNGPLGVPLNGTLVWLPDGRVPVSPEVLARQAVSRLNLPLPAIRINPVPPASQITFVPSWFWVDAGSWGSRSATASVPGLTVTATARATSLLFNAGDGATVTCTGPGTPWTAGKDPMTASACGHTYQQAGSFVLRGTVTWTVTWAGGGATGSVAPLTATATLAVQVIEAPALNGSVTG